MELNKKTESDGYQFLSVWNKVQRMKGAKWFSQLDLNMSYCRIEIHPADRYKTGFVTPYGHYEFIRMPFGLKNALQMFQRAMNDII